MGFQASIDTTTKSAIFNYEKIYQGARVAFWLKVGLLKIENV